MQTEIQSATLILSHYNDAAKKKLPEILLVPFLVSSFIQFQVSSAKL